jgi:benzoyl-CoA reductase/2-hydroxyglutaryl-CoA dehydratase subunit BcrC/BadD/HgdB
MCDVVVMPTTCDGKVKMAEILSNIKPVWVMELPKNRDHLEARDLWISQVQIFIKKLEKLTGKSIPRAAIEASVKLCRERTDVTRQLLELRKAERPVISGRDTLLVIQTAFSDDIHRWTQHTKDLVKELSIMSSQGKSISKEDAVRIMMTGSPVIWPTWKVLTAIEEAGGIIVIDDSCAGSQWFYNTVEVPDYAMKSMIYAIADKYLLPTICPVFIHSDDRVDRILELYSQYKAEGVVYHVLRLCQLIDFEHSKVSAILRPKNIPVLKVETEFGEEDIEQIKTRVEAFLEMIRVRRK